MSKPRVSIVIINKNDRGVANTLAALTSLRPGFSFEIVVIDASNGKLDDIARSFPAATWINFKPKPTKLISIPEQRNLGVQTAKANIIVFIDANCIPRPQWLPHLVQPIFRGEESIVAGATLSEKDTAHNRTIELQATRRYLHECPTINLAFTREAFNVIGGFDERFDYGSDVDFSWRALAAGYKVRYAAEAQITHDWGGASENVKRAYRYGVARARLYKKHPAKYKQLLTHDSTVLIYSAYLLGLPLTFWFWSYPLLIVVPFLKNIRHNPFFTLRYHLIYAIGALREVVRL